MINVVHGPELFSHLRSVVPATIGCARTNKKIQVTSDSGISLAKTMPTSKPYDENERMKYANNPVADMEVTNGEYNYKQPAKNAASAVMRWAVSQLVRVNPHTGDHINSLAVSS